eukprot:Anaeramoba_ignava/a352048_10.p1 GENE.a352048_10~~a352048_10.p1  ORF type:complete len:167 (-),score=11.32 a352048_10:328-828(-)
MREVINHNILSYEGYLTYDQINTLLEELQSKLDEYSTDTIFKKRLYSSAVEALENILRHSQKSPQKGYPPRFDVQSVDDATFQIEICNLVTKQQKSELKERIDFINNNFGQLKSIFAKKLRNSHISEEGGAGLGMYIIGKNSSNKLTYKFTKINEKQSYFCLTIKI